MIKSILVGFFVLFGLTAEALVPVEGVLLGEAVNEYQLDPLFQIFNDIYDKTLDGENKKIRLYQSTIESGSLLQESCHLYKPPLYDNSWMEKQARRSMASTLQYLGIDTSIKAIGAYAKKLEVTEDAFQKLTTNLVNNYCSKNVTVFSIKKIKESLLFYYKNPDSHLIPSVESSPFATTMFKTQTEAVKARSSEFDLSIQNFKAFCSWGGDVTDYRLLVPYLRNGFIMSFIIKNMSGVHDKFDPTSRTITQVENPDTLQVGCTDLICRKTSFATFSSSFPRSIGSTGLYTDLAKLYCHHFKFQDYSSSSTVPTIKNWIKKMELEDPIFETSFFLSLMTGVPDPTFSVENYRDIPSFAKSSIDERWNLWANGALKQFSHDMLFEESLKIKAQPRRDKVVIRTEGFKLDFSVTLGEMDRIVDDTDKLKLSFDLKLSKNYLRHIRTKWIEYTNSIDEVGRRNFRDEVVKYVGVQLSEKEKYFRQKMWTDEFSRLIVQELVEQILVYQGPLFDSYQEEVLRIPVKFSYGVFALSYLRYRSDVNSGRLRLNL